MFSEWYANRKNAMNHLSVRTQSHPLFSPMIDCRTPLSLSCPRRLPIFVAAAFSSLTLRNDNDASIPPSFLPAASSTPDGCFGLP